MRAISLWQPWASLLVLGSKKIETRSWPTAYRGPLLIHAAKRKNYSEFADMGRHWEACGIRTRTALAIPDELKTWREICDWLPYGAVLGIVDLVDCKPTDGLENVSAQEFEFGNYGPGRFGWITKNAGMFPEPIPYKGSQGFFNIPVEALQGYNHDLNLTGNGSTWVVELH